MAEPAVRQYDPTRSRRAPNIPAARWQTYKPLIEDMRARNFTRAQILQTLEVRYRFSPSLAQLDAKLGQWGFTVRDRAQGSQGEAWNEVTTILYHELLRQPRSNRMSVPSTTETPTLAASGAPQTVQLGAYVTLLEMSHAVSRTLTEKTTLSQALLNADLGGLCDNNSDVPGATRAYGKACNSLEQVIIQMNDSEDRRKLSAIRSTYSTRIAELRDHVVDDDTLPFNELPTVLEAPENSALLKDPSYNLAKLRMPPPEPVISSEHDAPSIKASASAPWKSNNEVGDRIGRGLHDLNTDAELDAAIDEAWAVGDQFSRDFETQLPRGQMAYLAALDYGQEASNQTAVNEGSVMTTLGLPLPLVGSSFKDWLLPSSSGFTGRDSARDLHLQDEGILQTSATQASLHINEFHERHKESLDATPGSSLGLRSTDYTVIGSAASGHIQNLSFDDDVFFPSMRDTKWPSQASSGWSSLHSLRSIAIRLHNGNANRDSKHSVSSGPKSMSSIYSFHRVAGYDRMSDSQRSMAVSVTSGDG